MFRIYDVDREEFIPTYDAFLECLDEDDRILADDLARRCVERGDPYIFDHRVTVGDGSVRWVQGRGRAIRDGSGRIVRLQGSSQDITDQRQAA